MARSALVIDDTRVTADSLVQMLRLLGFDTRVAYGARAAIEALAQRTPDVIMLDINMPGVDGLEVCRYIRRDPRTARVPILATSTDTQETMVERIQEAGANLFLPKPVGLEALEPALLALGLI